jgi:hypothetical protein
MFSIALDPGILTQDNAVGHVLCHLGVQFCLTRTLAKVT